MKIVFLASRVPFPPIDGHRTNLYHYCRILGEVLGHDLVVACLVDDRDLLKDKPAFIRDLHPLERPSVLGRGAVALVESLLLRRSSLQSSLYWSAANQARLEQLVAAERPDLVIADMTRTARYLAGDRVSGIPRLLMMDDMLSRRYARLVEGGDAGDTNLMGDFASAIPGPLRAILTSELQRRVLAIEAELLRREEASWAGNYDAVTLVSSLETERLGALVPGARVRTVPNGVDCQAFRPAKEKRAGPPTVVFLGLLSQAHNQAAVLHFHGRILPILRECVPGVRFLVVGNKPPDAIRRLAAQDPAVEVTGWVDDVPAALRRGRVFVAPLLFGSGVKTKILEAMALGLPVVATSVAAEGIQANNGKEIVVSDDPEAFAAAVARLIENPEEAGHIGAAGRAFVERTFSWDAVARAFSAVLEEVMAGPAEPRAG